MVGEGYSGGLCVCVCVCVYVDSHLRIQFNLTGLLGKGMVVVCMCVCTQSF